MSDSKVTILCSGVTLGIYVPALVINRQLNDRGVSSDVVVLEELFLNEKQEKLTDMKKAFHRNFAFALMGQKFNKGIWDSLDNSFVDKMFDVWRTENRKRFLVFSGFWMPILEKYLETIDQAGVSVELCHMDATTAVSWQSFEDGNPCYYHQWLFSWEKKQISAYIDIAGRPPIPFSDRKERLIIHGGGWGIGTYKDLLPELSDQHIDLDVIAYEDRDIAHRVESNRYFLLKPDWKPWLKADQGIAQFPPLGEVQNDGSIEYRNNTRYSEVYNILQEEQAIISKPGGATLIDSLSSATPVIFLDPFGAYESKNALLWEHFGFGVPYEKWKDSGYSVALIEELQNNLIAKRAMLPNYMEVLNATENGSYI